LDVTVLFSSVVSSDWIIRRGPFTTKPPLSDARARQGVATNTGPAEPVQVDSHASPFSYIDSDPIAYPCSVTQFHIIKGTQLLPFLCSLALHQHPSCEGWKDVTSLCWRRWSFWLTCLPIRILLLKHTVEFS
jgi:hypothetical protein